MIEQLFEDYGNNHYLMRYRNMIDAKYHVSDDAPWEKHHVLPRSLYPERSKDFGNIVLVPARVHYLLHWLLAKGTNTKQMWFAFNQMNRVIKKSW